MSTLSLVKVRQGFSSLAVENIETSIHQQLVQAGIKFKPQAAIAVAVGSRGIANIERIVRTTVAFLRASGAQPFIVPAMGSHGGATAEGQRQLLASYRITEDLMGCPVRSCMDVIPLPSADLENAVFMDRHAYNSDGVILINRIKPHTDFHGRYESGLCKMAVIGLGKREQACEMHRFGTYGLRELIPKTAAHILASGKILLGIALVEDAYEQTARIEAIPAASILSREPELLEFARVHMPRLPVDAIDVLIIDQMGKNISGSGIDTNIIGRIKIQGEPEPVSPRIKSIAVCDLTDCSHGNATGVGLADVTTLRLLNKMNAPVTQTNIITSGFLERGKLPVAAVSDQQAFEYARRGAGHILAGHERIIRIQDTLHLAELYVSEAILHNPPHLEVLGGPVEMFDSTGQLRPF